MGWAGNINGGARDFFHSSLLRMQDAFHRERGFRNRTAPTTRPTNPQLPLAAVDKFYFLSLHRIFRWKSFFFSDFIWWMTLRNQAILILKSRFFSCCKIWYRFGVCSSMTQIVAITIFSCTDGVFSYVAVFPSSVFSQSSKASYFPVNTYSHFLLSPPCDQWRRPCKQSSMSCEKSAGKRDWLSPSCTWPD